AARHAAGDRMDDTPRRSCDDAAAAARSSTAGGARRRQLSLRGAPPPGPGRWRLLDIFAVLLVAAVAFRVAGVPAALLSLTAFALTHHELPALTWAALNLL